jgi:hypothetical protein
MATSGVKYVYSGVDIGDASPYFRQETASWSWNRGVGVDGADQLVIYLPAYSATALELPFEPPVLSSL